MSHFLVPVHNSNFKVLTFEAVQTLLNRFQEAQLYVFKQYKYLILQTNFVIFKFYLFCSIFSNILDIQVFMALLDIRVNKLVEK